MLPGTKGTELDRSTFPCVLPITTRFKTTRPASSRLSRVLGTSGPKVLALGYKTRAFGPETVVTQHHVSPKRHSVMRRDVVEQKGPKSPTHLAGKAYGLHKLWTSATKEAVYVHGRHRTGYSHGTLVKMIPLQRQLASVRAPLGQMHKMVLDPPNLSSPQQRRFASPT